MAPRERVLSSKIRLIAVSLLVCVPAFADVVLAPPPQKEHMTPDQGSYPESRFGHQPVRVDTGVSSGYASRAVEDLEGVREEDLGGSSRSLASVKGAMQKLNADVATQAPVKSGIQEIALIAGDLGYFPKTVFVTRDIPVRLFVTGASKNSLCLMMDSFQIKKQIKSQKIEEISFTPNIPGKYRFYCPINGMEGTMVVKELASSAPVEAQ